MICESFFEWKSHSAETYTGRKRRWEITELRSWRHWHFYTAWNIRRLYCFRSIKMEKISNVSPNRYKKTEKPSRQYVCVHVSPYRYQKQKKARVDNLRRHWDEFWKKQPDIVQEQIHYWLLRARISNRQGVYSESRANGMFCVHT